MANPYYTRVFNAVDSVSTNSSTAINQEFDLIEAGLELLSSGNGTLFRTILGEQLSDLPDADGRRGKLIAFDGVSDAQAISANDVFQDGLSNLSPIFVSRFGLSDRAVSGGNDFPFTVTASDLNANGFWTVSSANGRTDNLITPAQSGTYLFIYSGQWQVDDFLGEATGKGSFGFVASDSSGTNDSQNEGSFSQTNWQDLFEDPTRTINRVSAKIMGISTSSAFKYVRFNSLRDSISEPNLIFSNEKVIGLRISKTVRSLAVPQPVAM